MTQTVGRSGVPFLMARDVAKNVTSKIRKESNNKSMKRKGGGSTAGKTNQKKHKEKIVTGSRLRNLVASELRERNRNDIVASYTGQVPANTLGEENLKDKQPSLDTVAANKNRVLHDTSKRGGGVMT